MRRFGGQSGGRACPLYREAISARLDNEDPGMDDEVIDAHLARCADCARFAEAAYAGHRRLRVRPAGRVPDLSGQILARLSAEPVPIPVAPPPAARAPARARLAAAPGRWGGRNRRAALVAAAVAVIGGGTAAFAGARLGAGSPAPSPAAPVAAPSVVAPFGPASSSSAAAADARYPGAIVTDAGVPKPEVVLTSTSGRPYDLSRATAGKVTLVYFGYTHCPDLCPINMALAATAMRDLPAAERDRITVVFITTDPARDTPSVIRAWLDRFSPSFVGLTGSIGAIRSAEVQAHVPLSYTSGKVGHGRNYQVVHSGYTLVYARDGRANLAVDDTAQPAQFATTLSHVLSYGFQDSSCPSLPCSSH